MGQMEADFYARPGAHLYGLGKLADYRLCAHTIRAVQQPDDCDRTKRSRVRPRCPWNVVSGARHLEKSQSCHTPSQSRMAAKQILGSSKNWMGTHQRKSY